MLHRTPDSYDFIFLADNEWGSQIMQEVAEQWFTLHPDCHFVEVHEHAGWFLLYHRSGTIVGSANDAARFAPDTPRPQRYSGIEVRREVTRPDRREIDSLDHYRNEQEWFGMIPAARRQVIMNSLHADTPAEHAFLKDYVARCYPGLTGPPPARPADHFPGGYDHEAAILDRQFADQV